MTKKETKHKRTTKKVEDVINLEGVKVVGYCRVSTKGQLDGNSIQEQAEKIKSKYPNAVIFEESYSGAKERPIFSEIIKKIENGSTLVVTKLDRFCRTTKEGLIYIDTLKKRDVAIHILNMGLVESSPMGDMIITNLLAFAEFERAMIIERTMSGKAIAKQRPDFVEGRPKKYTKAQLDNAMSMLTTFGGTHSFSDVERLLGISKSTLTREARRRKIKVTEEQDKCVK